MYRSLLFVPAHEEKYYLSAKKACPDVLIYDLEDSVPENAKSIAKELISKKIEKKEKQKNFIRIRYDRTDSYYEDILDTIALPIQGYILPKVESAYDVVEVSRTISYLEKENGIMGYAIKLICLIESPKGILNIAKIAENTDRVIGIGFGGEDYSASINAETVHDVFLHPRSSIIVAAKAFKLLVFDTVYLNYMNNEGFRQELTMNKELGFDGKLLIHPNQVMITNEVFSYSKKQVDGLLKIIEEFEKIKKQDNKNVAIIDNVVYEEPHIKRLKSIVKRYR